MDLWLHQPHLGAATAASASHRKVPSSVAPCATGISTPRLSAVQSSQTWKIHPFLIGKPSINGPSIPWRSVSHNQMVDHLGIGISLFLPGLEYIEIKRHCLWNDAERTAPNHRCRTATNHRAGLRGNRGTWHGGMAGDGGNGPLGNRQPVVAVVVWR